jgi:hypothetical protein
MPAARRLNPKVTGLTVTPPSAPIAQVILRRPTGLSTPSIGRGLTRDLSRAGMATGRNTDERRAFHKDCGRGLAKSGSRDPYDGHDRR